MARRRTWSRTDRLKLFQAHEGRCHLCLGKIGVGEAWEVSHDTPLELGGADDDTNAKPAHARCHRAHTATVDQPNIARAKRREAKHCGAQPKSRLSHPTLRRKVNGQTVNKFTGERA